MLIFTVYAYFHGLCLFSWFMLIFMVYAYFNGSPLFSISRQIPMVFFCVYEVGKSLWFFAHFHEAGIILWFSPSFTKSAKSLGFSLFSWSLQTLMVFVCDGILSVLDYNSTRLIIFVARTLRGSNPLSFYFRHQRF